MAKEHPSDSESNTSYTGDSEDGLVTGTSGSGSAEKPSKHLNDESDEEVIPPKKSQPEVNRPSQQLFFDDNVIGQKYVELAKLPEKRRVHGRHIVWNRTQNVLELPILGHFRTYEKRTDRARPNPWRRHGALMKIHEIGGWVSKLEKQQVSRRNRKYFYVRAGSKPCNPPTRPLITIRESKFLPPSSVSIPPTATSQNVNELAYVAAVQIQEAIQNSVSNHLESQQIGTAVRAKVVDANGKDYSVGKAGGPVGRSSSVQRVTVRPGIPLGAVPRSRSLSSMSRKR